MRSREQFLIELDIQYREMQRKSDARKSKSGVAHHTHRPIIKNTPKISKSQTNISKLKTCSQEEKDSCLLNVKKAASVGLKTGRDLYAGFNSVMKLVASDRAAAVVSFRDTNTNIFNAVKDAAEAKGVPVVVFPRVSGEFGVALGLKKLSTFGIPFATHLEGSEPKENENSDYHALGIALDEMRDHLVLLGETCRVAMIS